LINERNSLNSQINVLKASIAKQPADNDMWSNTSRPPRDNAARVIEHPQAEMPNGFTDSVAFAWLLTILTLGLFIWGAFYLYHLHPQPYWH
jgi:hypothetical protein